MLNVIAFLQDRFQTPAGVHAFLAAYGAAAPGIATVEKWFQRRSVPAPWFAMLLAFLELENGEPVSIIPYLENGNAGIP